jgi:hypothetical protein
MLIILGIEEYYELGPEADGELYCKGKIVVLSAGGNIRYVFQIIIY